MENIQILYPKSFSLTFPKKIKKEIARDNIIELIQQLLENNDVIFITGDSEIGKTTLLSQFVDRHLNNSISCFLKPINKFSSNLENIIIDFLGQINFILVKQELPENTVYDLTTLVTYFSRLNKNSRGIKTYYLILDGFEYIDEHELYFINELFQQLPLGYPSFKFLISDNQDYVYKTFLKDIIKKGKLTSDKYPLAPLSLLELSSFFQDLNLSKDQLNEVQKITSGNPGRLKSIHDKLKEGISFDELFDKIDTYTDLMEMEFSSIKLADDLTKNILSLLALEDTEYNIAVVSRILSINAHEIKKNIEVHDFLEIDGNDSISFKSLYFKKYLRKKFAKHQNEIDELIINYHLNNLTDINSLLELPKRYEKNKKYEELLKVLDESHFYNILKKKESFSFLEDQTSIGIKAALGLKKDIDLFRLSLQKASIAEVKHTYISEAEIEAKIELKDFNSARDLAEQSLVKEDKFRLLVFLSRKKKEKGLSVETELTDAIKILYSQINPASFYDAQEITNIATNLLYIIPEYGIEFLEKATGNISNTASDLGFANLLLLMKKLNETETLSEESITSISSRIKDPKIKNFANAFSNLYGRENVEAFISQVNNIELPNEKLQAIRVYISENTKTANIEKAIEFAINLVINYSHENPINASTLNEITIPLPFLAYEKSSVLINQLDSFKSLSKERGPTTNHFKFLTHLACAELNGNLENASLRFAEIFIEINELKDYSIKIDSFAYVYSSLRRLDSKGRMQKKDNLESQIITAIDSLFFVLLKETASQFNVLKNLIAEMAKVDQNKCIDFCKQINTSSRRNLAYLHALKSYLKNDFIDIKIDEAKKFYVNILDPKVKNQASIKILEKFATYEKDALNDFPEIKQFIDNIEDFYSNRDKAYAFKLTVSILNNNNNSHEAIMNNILVQIMKLWRSLDDKFRKIDFGFNFSATLLSINKKHANIFLDLAEKEKKSLIFQTPISLSLYINSLRLGVRALQGIMASKVDYIERLNKLISYIKLLPGSIMQIKLISAILSNVYFSGDKDLFETLFEEHLKEFVDYIQNENSHFSKEEKYDLIRTISPIVYIKNAELAYVLIDKLSYSFYRDTCYDGICEFVIYKGKGNQSTIDSENLKLKIEFGDALSVISILRKIDFDVIISNRIRELKNAARNNSFTRENVIIIGDKIRELIDEKLPDLNNICHDGYKILCTAYLYKIIKNEKETDWKLLIEGVNKIDNYSDKAFVISSLSTLIPGLRAISKTALMQDALSIIDGFHSYISRVERYADIKENIKEISEVECKERLKKAINDSTTENTFELYDRQKEIIDFAYELDNDFAEELIKIVNNDPARESIGERLKTHLKTLYLKKDFVNDKLTNDINEIKSLTKICEDYSDKLLKGRVSSRRLEKLAPLLNTAHSRPISESYSIYHFFIINANERFNSTQEQATKYLLPIFEAILKNIQMVKVLANRTKTTITSTTEERALNLSSHLIITPGQGHTAIDFISRWVKSEVVEYIKICDPYFKSEDLELVKEIFLLKQDIKFSILAQDEYADKGDLREKYTEKWSRICDQDPPEIRVVIVGYRNGNNDQFISPSHDRWYITYKSGLRVGTSYNSIGKKNSEISIMTEAEAKDIEVRIIDKYLEKKERFSKGKRLWYQEFDL